MTLAYNMYRAAEAAAAKAAAEAVAKAVAEAREKALKEGREEGIAIGEERGISLGITQGAREAKLETAKVLKSAGVSINLIIDSTGLSIEEIEKL